MQKELTAGSVLYRNKRKEVRKSWKTCRLPESDVPDQPTSMQTFVMQSIATKYK
jgi:hypothetical protein